jgi:hypothetical protein
MIPLFLAQLLVPALLVVWLLILPPRSFVGWITQFVGSAALITVIARMGLWLFPPWWVPRVALIVAVLVGAWHVHRRRWSTVLPSGARAWAGVVLFSCAAALGIYGLTKAVSATRLPEGADVVELAFPLDTGRYLVVNGGAWLMINAHRASMDSTIHRLRPWRGNGHAVDIVAVDALGTRATGLLPRAPSAYRIFGVHVLAPCSGRVVTAVDGVLDLPVPQQDLVNKSGNHVILDCAGVHIVLAHFQQGSVRVSAGQEVKSGEWIGSVGNSGMSSEPHLHIHAQRPGPPDAPVGGDPLPMLLDGRFLVRGDRVRVASDP